MKPHRQNKKVKTCCASGNGITNAIGRAKVCSTVLYSKIFIRLLKFIKGITALFLISYSIFFVFFFLPFCFAWIFPSLSGIVPVSVLIAISFLLLLSHFLPCGSWTPLCSLRITIIPSSIFHAIAMILLLIFNDKNCTFATWMFQCI